MKKLSEDIDNKIKNIKENKYIPDYSFDKSELKDLSMNNMNNAKNNIKSKMMKEILNDSLMMNNKTTYPESFKKTSIFDNFRKSNRKVK